MPHTTYTDAGTGDTLVFLHGFAESKQLWTDFKKPLQQQFRTIALDLPGFGNNTTADVTNYSMDAMADYVKQQLDKLGVKNVS